MDWLIALVALTSMEMVLGIDNIVLIVVLAGRLPQHQQAKARATGLGIALVTRILLLLSISWVLSLQDPLFSLSQLGVPEPWLPNEVDEISLRDIVLLAGGLFLLGKSVHDIHENIEGAESDRSVSQASRFGQVIAQIVVLDLVFSLDSVITAVGMANQVWVMVVAIMLAVGLMLIASNKVNDFVHRHPTVKMLALSFLLLIGVMLVAEGIGTTINKGYIYFAMAFALVVEILNQRVVRRGRTGRG